jgi:predicted O-linked N-acetylglucosamine transferase (SPINDLY family)
MSKKRNLSSLRSLPVKQEKQQFEIRYSDEFKDYLELHRKGKINEAFEGYQKILFCNEKDFQAAHMAGLACKQLGMPELALSYYERAINLKELDASLQSNYGNLLLSLKRFEDSVKAYDHAIFLQPEFSTAHYNRGLALDALKKYEHAVLSYSLAIKLDKKSPDYFLSRGNSYQQLKLFALAVSDYLDCLKIRNNDYVALLNLGIAYFKNRQLDLSLITFQNAEKFHELDPELHYFKGNVLREMGNIFDAITSYLRAIKLDNNKAKYFVDLGNAQLELKLMSDAIQSYRRALQINCDFPYLIGHLIHINCQVANWDELQTDLYTLRIGVEKGSKVSVPFPLLALIDSPSIAQKASYIFYLDQYQEIYKSNESKLKINIKPKGEKLKIGYYSSDFYLHATSYLIAQLFEQHDKSKFEIVCFSFNGKIKDEMSKRIELAFDHYYDVSHLTDEDIAKLSRQISIDIAVDLKGYTQNNRTAIFAHRCAPIQLSYLGYPGTMSAPFIDFIIADKTVIPLEEVKYYNEKIVYLPNSYQVNDSKREIAPHQSFRAEHNLPEDAFIFCCFNNTYKIQPNTFALWMRILKRTTNSVLWLLEDSQQASQNLRKHAQMHQVDCSRLVFAKRMDLSTHLERHRHAQLFLDTFPYNAHTTASDSLWSGLLVLTLIGQSFASRVCASLLFELGLEEFICNTEQEYEDRAVFWAQNKELLRIQKNKLSKTRNSSTLFRGDLFAQSMELAYKNIYSQYIQGNGFQNIDLTI